jgi:prolyl oligopeptidase
MIRLDTKAGHGAGKPTSKSIEEYTDIFCFLIRALGIQYRQEEGEFLLLF